MPLPRIGASALHMPPPFSTARGESANPALHKSLPPSTAISKNSPVHATAVLHGALLFSTARGFLFGFFVPVAQEETNNRHQCESDLLCGTQKIHKGANPSLCKQGQPPYHDKRKGKTPRPSHLRKSRAGFSFRTRAQYVQQKLTRPKRAGSHHTPLHTITAVPR